MKIIKLLLILLVSFSFIFAQESPAKTKLFGINPFGLLLNIYSGHYGMIINNGANELNFPFFYWQPLDELTIIGGGAKYRIYKNGNGNGLFYGGTVSVMSISWDYETFDFDENFNLVTTTETITGVTFTPGGEAGYRWSWDNSFTLAPTLGAGFTIGKIEASDGSEADFGSSGLTWSIGIGLAYMW
ncbi:MAG: hypothetical protein IIB95_02930 [Candidatus Marinimicrobia bacterium]|nr:hypothetical protein [Candidatus Neomarinimicrobiota bacterium]MCH7762682.1 hypothetical protein [Candidatus Neomarinimicrobiota bacterium]